MKIRSVFVVVCALHVLVIFLFIECNLIAPPRPKEPARVMVRTVSLAAEHIAVAATMTYQATPVPEISNSVIPVDAALAEEKTTPATDIECPIEPVAKEVEKQKQEIQAPIKDPELKTEPVPASKKTDSTTVKKQAKKEVKNTTKNSGKKRQVEKKPTQKKPETKKDTAAANKKPDPVVKKAPTTAAAPAASKKQATSTAESKKVEKKDNDVKRTAALQELLSSLDAIQKQGQIGSQGKVAASTQQQKSVLALQSEGIVVAEGTAEWKTPQEKSYYDELVSRLQLELRLPEYGHVKVKLTLSSKGTFQKLVVTESKSKKNREYVEKRVAELRFPPFGQSFNGASEHTFLLNLSNAMSY